MASTKQYMVPTPRVTEQSFLKHILNTSSSERRRWHLGHLWKNTDHGSGVVGNEGAEFGAGTQEDPVSCQKFHALEQVQDLQKVQREHLFSH